MSEKERSWYIDEDEVEEVGVARTVDARVVVRPGVPKIVEYNKTWNDA